MARYELYEANGRQRANINGKSYLLMPNENAASDARQCQLIRQGVYGTVAQLYACACDEVGVPLTYAWDGIVNELGDHARVTPPWKGKPHNYGR